MFQYPHQNFGIRTLLLCILLTALSFTSTSVLSADRQSVIADYAIAFENMADFQPLLDQISGQRLVLLGESTHGTSEFYRWRAALSKELIKQKSYDFIVVEGDWPAFSRINEYVKHKPGAPESIEAAMAAIDRWPYWMWRNHETRELVEWLRNHNHDLEPEDRIGIYGMDLYAKQNSMQDVIAWFELFDTDKAGDVRDRYGCLSRFEAVQDYIAQVAQTGQTCAYDVQKVLRKVQDHRNDHAGWAYFSALQNAKLVVNAERHYRSNLERGPAGWNYRAGHFEQTTHRLLDYYGEGSKGIVWAHNTHIGDARATDMAQYGMENIGQLSRERWGRDQIYAIGFGTYSGEVYAAREWAGQRQRMKIPSARMDSWERLLEETGPVQFLLLLQEAELREVLQQAVPHRAIGVVYHPERDRGNYVDTVMPERYDAFVFIRQTSALSALD